MINHIAIIPDGNRRWAKKRKLNSWIGHQKGARVFAKILEKAVELKIPCVTFWGGSFDNLTKRSKIETKFLAELYTEYFNKITKDKRTHENKVKVLVLGRWREVLPLNVQKSIDRAVKATENYNKYLLVFLLAYNGTDEITEAIKEITKATTKESVKKITFETIKSFLWTKDLPPVDLVIRTGCENDPHNSAGFMMWHTAYSQYYFTKTLFPDFGPKEFEFAINGFLKRERRFGK